LQHSHRHFHLTERYHDTEAYPADGAYIEEHGDPGFDLIPKKVSSVGKFTWAKSWWSYLMVRRHYAACQYATSNLAYRNWVNGRVKRSPVFSSTKSYLIPFTLKN
jgi:hypothetical protein